MIRVKQDEEFDFPEELAAPIAVTFLPSDVWRWLPKEGIYRHELTGRTITQKGMRRLFDSYQTRARIEVRNLAQRLADGVIDMKQWEAGMREVIKDTYSTGYMLGRGGKLQMTQADWGSVGGQLKNQYRYLNGFYEAVAAGDLTPAQIGARAELYINSATQSIERGRARGLGAPELPAWPADGSSECLASCRCFWSIEETDTEWLATWTLTPAEHCPTCLERAQIWNPLLIPK
jgi:hypothetical protein